MHPKIASDLNSKAPEGHHLRAQPSARLSEEICPSEGSSGGLSEGSTGVSQRFCGALRGSVGVRGIFRGFPGGSDPMLVTLGNCWIEIAEAKSKDSAATTFARSAVMFKSHIRTAWFVTQASVSVSPKPHPSKPHPCKSENTSCAAILGKLRCRSCTATFAFLQCGSHFLPKAALQQANNCTSIEYNFDHPHPPYWQKMCSQNMP